MDTKQDKRQQLRVLSNTLKEKKEIDQTFAPDATTVNDLLTYYYKLKGHSQLKTFKEWLKNGYCVRKGETALLLWATPVDRNKTSKKQEQTVKENEESKKEEFFPICYVFSEKQVSKVEKGTIAS